MSDIGTTKCIITIVVQRGVVYCHYRIRTTGVDTTVQVVADCAVVHCNGLHSSSAYGREVGEVETRTVLARLTGSTDINTGNIQVDISC